MLCVAVAIFLLVFSSASTALTWIKKLSGSPSLEFWSDFGLCTTKHAKNFSLHALFFLIRLGICGIYYTTCISAWLRKETIRSPPHCRCMGQHKKLLTNLFCCVHLCCTSLKGALSVSERLSMEDHCRTHCTTSSTLSAGGSGSRHIQFTLSPWLWLTV